jgi:glycosyltransferase involved in cell wall biosynthesis
LPKILFVSTSTTLGGAEKTLFTLATLLDQKEFEIAGIVSLKPPGFYAERLVERGLKVESLGMPRWPGWTEAKALSRIIQREKPDIVHAFMYQAIELCRLVKKISASRFTLISSPRVNYRTRSWATLLVDRALKNADNLLIAESRASRDFLVERLGYAPDRVTVIHNGIDPAPFSPLNHQPDPDQILVGTIGRLDVQKNQGLLISAMAALRHIPRLRCVIVGEGPARARLERQIRRLGLEKSVRLAGENADAAASLASFDIFALPSLWEGLPNALLEAMAMGLPVVAAHVDGVGEAVTSEKDGLLVPPQDAAALAQGIARLVDDGDLRRRLGEAARARVLEDFSLPAMISGYANAYRLVLTL